MDIPEGHVVSFHIVPGTPHAFKNVGNTVGYLLCYADIPFDESDLEQIALLD